MSALPSIRHAWRSLRRTPVFTAAAVLTLVIGIGATIAVFVVVNSVLLRPLPYRDPGRLVDVWFDMPAINLMHAQQTRSSYDTFRKLAHTIDGMALYQDGSVNIAEPGGASEPERMAIGRITATLIPVLGVTPLLGRNFTSAEDLPRGPNAVIISEGLWRSRFGGDPRAVGRTMDINGVTFQVVGVMPARFRFPSARTELWLPLALDPNDTYSGGFNLNGVARLTAGVSPAAAERELTALLPRWVELYPNFAPNVSTQMVVEQARPRPVVVPMIDDVTGGIARTLWMVAVAAGLVLLVSCANVSNLILVRADGRQREFAVREALGAGRGRVLLLFLAESGVLAAIAAVLGLALAALAIRGLVVSGPAAIPRLAEVRVDGAAVAFTAALAVLVALFCSAIPALRLGGGSLAQSLREGGRSGTGGRAQQRVRGALVAAQIAIALVVLAGSGLLVRTFERMHAIRPGFDPAHVATFWLALPPARYSNDSSVARFYEALVSRIGGMPGVGAVGLTSRLPLEPHGTNYDPLYPEGDPTYARKIPPLQQYTTVDSGYFRAMGIPLVAGRVFAGFDAQRADEAIISRNSAITFWHDSTGNAAVGKRFTELPGGPLLTVVGVVGDVRDSALAAPPSHAVYLPEVAGGDTLIGHFSRTMALVVRTAGDPSAVTGAVRSSVREMDPALPLFDVRPMSAVLDDSMAQLSFIIIILGAAAAVTLALGAVGLYGVMAYVVTLRTRELGVRIALGAQPGAVAAMMTRQGIALTGIGIALGLVLFSLVARFLRSFLYEVAPSDPTTLAAAALLLTTIAALASWIPARRASRVDPSEALRAE